MQKMTSILSVTLVAVVLALVLAPKPSDARDGLLAVPGGLRLAAAPGPVTLAPQHAAGRLSPLRRVQFYGCRRACRQCRRVCIVDWKWDCYGSHCRRAFSDCMKACWEDICREC